MQENVNLQIGDKCKYLYGGKWRKGKVHAVITHEDENGIIARLAYQVDTGVKTKQTVDEFHEKTGVWTGSHEAETDQPEQVEVEATNIKLA